MHFTRARLLAFIASGSMMVFGCGETQSTNPDGGSDAGQVPDSGQTIDSGSQGDAGVGSDSGVPSALAFGCYAPESGYCGVARWNDGRLAANYDFDGGAAACTDGGAAAVNRCPSGVLGCCTLPWSAALRLADGGLGVFGIDAGMAIPDPSGFDGGLPDTIEACIYPDAGLNQSQALSVGILCFTSGGSWSQSPK